MIRLIVYVRICGETFSDFLHEMADQNAKVVTCPKCGKIHEFAKPKTAKSMTGAGSIKKTVCDLIELEQRAKASPSSRKLLHLETLPIYWSSISGGYDSGIMFTYAALRMRHQWPQIRKKRY